MGESDVIGRTLLIEVGDACHGRSHVILQTFTTWIEFQFVFLLGISTGRSSVICSSEERHYFVQYRQAQFGKEIHTANVRECCHLWTNVCILYK